MKRLIRLSFSILALMLISIGAKAISFTVVADPAHMEKITAGSNTDPKTMAFSTTGVMNTIDEMSFVYLEFTPKANVTYTVYVYDSAGNLKSTWANKSAKYKGFAMKANIDGGKVVVESTMSAENPTMTLTINGNPAKVDAMWGENKIENLKQGDNVIDVKNTYFFLKNAGGNIFYKVTYNGVEKSATEDAAEGSASYYYMFSKISDGDKIVVDVDFPEGMWTVTITVPEGCDDYIQRVAVDGSPVADWHNLQVRGGQKVEVAGDKYNYITKGSSIDGVPTTEVSSSMSAIVSKDIEFGFDVEKIIREKSFVFFAADYVKASMMTSINSYRTIDKGYSTIMFCEEDNPIYIFSEYNGTSQKEQTAYYYVNDELVGSNINAYALEASENDVVKVFYTDNGQEPARYDVSFAGNFTVMPDVKKDYVRTVTESAASMLKGTVVTIASTPYVTVESVTLNGMNVSVSGGVWSFTVNAKSNVNIVCSQSESETVTLGPTGMSSYVSIFNTVFDGSGVKAYIATGIDNQCVALDEVEGVVPAGTGLILSGEAGAEVEVAFTSDEATASVAGNLLRGVLEGEVIPGSTDEASTYVFGTVEGETGFWRMTGDKLNAAGNHAYITVPNEAGEAKFLGFTIGGTTGIEGASAEHTDGGIYTIQGVKVERISQPGLYIVNGKKTVK